MQKPPTMKDVAKATGVSVMTVSRAFKQDASVSTDTRDLIRKTAEEMGYVFDTIASNLRSQRSGFIAVTIPSINNANFADTVGALSERLGQAGLQVLLGYTNYDIQQEEQLVEQLLRRRPEAIVVTGGRHTDRTRRLLSNAGIPVVETWDLPEAPIGHVVGFSNAATMLALVDHLVNQGFTRLAFIGGDTDGDTRGADRRRGFITAMQQHKLDASRLIGAGQPPISMREGAVAMAKLLDQMPDTEAVICVSDLSAFGALTECMRRGVSVPNQMAIAGFGAYEISAISVPTITTVNPFPRDIGRQTAELIISVLAPDNRQTSTIVIEIKPQVTPGQSTAKPR
jgi:LacI family transcriptional regulator, gluconate utilization system Gnt-I transcriptional repressor